jgi:hypothetical protein
MSPNFIGALLQTLELAIPANDVDEGETTLMSIGGTYSPGPYRGPNEPVDLHEYPEAPKSPFRPDMIQSRAELNHCIDNGTTVLISFDLSRIVGASVDLLGCSDKSIMEAFLFVDTLMDHGGPYAEAGETVEVFSYRQRARVVQARAREMFFALGLSKKLMAHLDGIAFMTPAERDDVRYKRYISLHKILINMEINPNDQTIMRVDRPNPLCMTCFNNDPRFHLYCDACYDILEIRM